MARISYGSGMRLNECLQLRVKDLDLARCEILIRDAKGQKDRVTMLPAVAQGPLRQHLARAKRRHDEDLARGGGCVALPGGEVGLALEPIGPIRQEMGVDVVRVGEDDGAAAPPAREARGGGS